ncbi:uncharacterized protein [Mytilus edulis]|uniref:uncharacterized protein n=1 Tax=Mytilus edulis TaxID=6550 RepID=UPI0039EF752B
MAGNRAPSVITYFNHSGEGDILVQNVYVPKDLCAKYTYYCCLNWNMGGVGGGYCGIQCHEDGNCFICSLWDPPVGTQRSIESVFKSDGNSFTERFGGEGEGLKYMNFEHRWEPDQWYTLVVRRWDQNGNTHFGLWVYDTPKSKWIRMITMAFPVPDIYFLSPVACFVEDWHGNGENPRGAKYKGTFKRSKDGSWECLKNCQYLVNQEDACKKWNNNFRIESEDCEELMMQTGGKTAPTCDDTRGQITMDTNLCRPKIPPTSFEVVKVTESAIEWNVNESSTPQFSYCISINGSEIESAVDPSCRKVENPRFQGSTIEIKLQDILGQEVSQVVTG